MAPKVIYWRWNLDQRPQYLLYLPRQGGKTTALIRAAAVMAERGYLPIFMASPSEIERRLRHQAAEFFAEHKIEPPKSRAQIKGVWAFIDELQHFSYIRASGDCLIANCVAGHYDDQSIRFNGLDIAGMFANIGVQSDQGTYRDWMQTNDPTFGIIGNLLCSVCGSSGRLTRAVCEYCGGAYEQGNLTPLEALLLECREHAKIIKEQDAAIIGAYDRGWRPNPMPNASGRTSYPTYAPFSSSATTTATTFTWTNTNTAINPMI